MVIDFIPEKADEIMCMEEKEERQVGDPCLPLSKRYNV
jgi:hypothetical protein